jgi:hypothetical protein
MKVYIVSTGEYSDWSIQGIFSTREKAEEFMRVVPAGGYDNEYNDIQEHELDPIIPHGKEHKYPYEIVFFSPNWELCFYSWDGEGEVYLKSEIFRDYADRQYRRITVRVWARDHAQALKIASDKKAEYLARKNGI